MYIGFGFESRKLCKDGKICDAKLKEVLCGGRVHEQMRLGVRDLCADEQRFNIRVSNSLKDDLSWVHSRGHTDNDRINSECLIAAMHIRQSSWATEK